MRYEYKYLVRSDQLPRLRQLVAPFVDLDTYARTSEQGLYTVRSIYFETPHFDFYTEKIEGVPNRKKLRIRGYNQPEAETTVFLEVKRKYQTPTLKYRAPLHFEDVGMIFRGRSIETYVHNSPKYPEAEVNARRFFYHMHSLQLRPAVLVVYEREAYQERCATPNKLRITFDQNLRSMAYPTLDDLFSEKENKPALPGYFVLEVKFNQTFPAWLSPVIDGLGLKRQALSKSVICRDSQDVRRHASRYQTQLQARFFHQPERTPPPHAE